jgi:hypothetical protein
MARAWVAFALFLDDEEELARNSLPRNLFYLFSSLPAGATLQRLRSIPESCCRRSRPKGKFAYAANYQDDNVCAYKIDASSGAHPANAFRRHCSLQAATSLEASPTESSMHKG